MRFQTPVTVLLAGVLIGSGVLLGAQTLGDVARKEEDRRKNGKGGTKVYTTKDLGSVPAPVPISPPAADAGRPRDAATTTAAATPPHHAACQRQPRGWRWGRA